MESVLGEIAKLRRGRPLCIDSGNSNRYRLLAAEEDGTSTAYYFGVPIYNKNTRRLVGLRFREEGERRVFEGSDAKITAAADGLTLENTGGSCRISFSDPPEPEGGRLLRCGKTKIFPTVNGLVFQAVCAPRMLHRLVLRSGIPFPDVRANDRCFSLMQERFKPFVTVSCIGAADETGAVTAPCMLTYQKNGDREFVLAFWHDCLSGRQLLYEINLQEAKLFQDTTVESLHPELNNAFGGTAFIGYTENYGEQWLYSRPDFSKLSELAERQIYWAALHVPRLGGAGGAAPAAFRIASRFCSFGSRWNNRIADADLLAETSAADGYQHLDLTELIRDTKYFWTQSEGFVWKNPERESGFSVLATGDSYFTPQILEVNFR